MRLELFRNIRLQAIIAGTLFFLFALVTLPHYGINWDTINHLPRGQAYLHYFLTGKKDYSDLPQFNYYFQDPKNLYPAKKSGTRSIYETNAADYTWFMEYDGNGHPPLSDILSAAFNKILFGKLHLINDIDAYRTYGVFLSSALVALLYIWVSRLYGKLSGAISALVLATYPLFWSESHFNTEKDIPETVFWSFFIFCFWKGIVKKSWRWFLCSGIFFGLALGTKFNIFFVFLVIFPWALVVLWKEKLKTKIALSIPVILSLLIGFIIFISSWPYLWPDPIARLMGVFGFYKQLGTTTNFVDIFYPIKWIIVTTPPITLVLAGFGIFFSIDSIRRKKDFNPLLFLLWLVIPIARVSWAGATIYGGVRQIMEFIPGLALISGIGMKSISDKLKISNIRIALLIFVSFVLIGNILRLHPNENVYFNFLANGLSGAKEKNIPSWGNTFGGAYRQGVVWLNENAERNSTVVLAHELTPNIPSIWFRPDLELNNRKRSGPAKGGEYAITLTYEGTKERSYYDSYLETILIPVFSVEVDKTAILKIWRNDWTTTNKRYLNEKEIDGFKRSKSLSGFTIDFGREYLLSKIVAYYSSSPGCSVLNYAYSEISLDGVEWVRTSGTMPKEDWNTSAFGEQPTGDKFIQPFAATKVRYVRYTVNPESACLNKITKLKIYAY